MMFQSNCWLGLQFEGLTGVGGSPSTHVAVVRRLHLLARWQLASQRMSDSIEREGERERDRQGRRGGERGMKGRE